MRRVGGSRDVKHIKLDNGNDDFRDKNVGLGKLATVFQEVDQVDHDRDSGGG